MSTLLHTLTLHVHHHVHSFPLNQTYDHFQFVFLKVAMPVPKTKAEWISFLHDQGENIPTSWTVTQMKAHWAELRAEAKDTPVEEMKKQLTTLNKAATKKGNLMLFLQEHGVTVNPNHAIAQMVSKGTQQIVSRFEPQDLEKVGFGIHGDMTYLALFEDQPGYVQWVLKTDQEDAEAGWRLKRLARWIRQHQSQTKVKASPKKPTISSPGSVSSFSVVDKMSEDQIRLQENMAAVERLREELTTRLAQVDKAAQELENEKQEIQESLAHKNRREM